MEMDTIDISAVLVKGVRSLLLEAILSGTGGDGFSNTKQCFILANCSGFQGHLPDDGQDWVSHGKN